MIHQNTQIANIVTCLRLKFLKYFSSMNVILLIMSCIYAYDLYSVIGLLYMILRAAVLSTCVDHLATTH